MVKGLVSNLETYHPTVHFTRGPGPARSCAFSTPRGAHSQQPFQRLEVLAYIAISVLPGTDLHRSEVKHVRMPKNTTPKPCPNVERGETYFSENLHQAGMEPALQTAAIILQSATL